MTPVAPDRPLGVALVGCAHIHARDAAEVINARADVRALAVWDADPDRARPWAEELGAPLVSDLEQIWSDPRISAVVLMCQTAQHPSLAQAAAGAGKHLYVEKPLGVDLAAALQVRRALQGAQALFHTGYHLREVPAHLALVDLTRRGRLGRVVRLRGRFAHRGAADGMFDSDFAWMTDPAAAGWGGFGDLGVHLLDLMGLLAGGAAARVTACLGPRPERGLERWGEGLVQYSSGVVASVAAGWSEYGGPVVLEVHGTEGRAVATDGALRVEPADAADRPIPEPMSPRAGAALDHFFAAALGHDGPPLVSVETAAEHCRVLEALYQAARDGCWIKL